MSERKLLLLSGGMKSTYQAYAMHAEGIEFDALHFQDSTVPFSKELEFAELHAERLRVRLDCIDISSLTRTWRNKRASSVFAFPEFYFAVSPSPLPLMLSLATQFAETRSYRSIVICLAASQTGSITPSFLDHWNRAIGELGGDRPHVTVEAPLLAPNAPNYLRHARELGVRLEYTWSCLNTDCGDACGKCTKCHLRDYLFSEDDSPAEKELDEAEVG